MGIFSRRSKLSQDAIVWESVFANGMIRYANMTSWHRPNNTHEWSRRIGLIKYASGSAKFIYSFSMIAPSQTSLNKYTVLGLYELVKITTELKSGARETSVELYVHEGGMDDYGRCNVSLDALQIIEDKVRSMEIKSILAKQYPGQVRYNRCLASAKKELKR